MVNPFIWFELFLYGLPPLAAYLAVIWLKPYLKRLPILPLNPALLLTPMWMACIHAFSLLIFSFSILPVVVLVICFMVGCHLFDYIRRVDRFEFRPYLWQVSPYIFIGLTLSLLSIAVLRIVTYFYHPPL